MVDVDGGLCPASPTGTGLFTSNLLESMFETLMPFMVAITFSRRLIEDAGEVLYVRFKKRRHGNQSTNAVQPFMFDSGSVHTVCR